MTRNVNRSARTETSPAGVNAVSTDVGAISEPSYVVGYRRPPLQHRFKPGHSGNRRGRPKRSHSTAAVFEEMFRSTVAMTIDGKRRRLTVRQVMALRAMKELLTGNPRVIERWLDYAEKVEERPAESQGSPLIDIGSFTEEQLRVLASIKIVG